MLFHIEGHRERVTELPGEETREEGDRVDQKEKLEGEGIKRGGSNLASNQIPMCSPQSGSLREVHEFA